MLTRQQWITILGVLIIGTLLLSTFSQQPLLFAIAASIGTMGGISFMAWVFGALFNRMSYRAGSIGIAVIYLAVLGNHFL